MTIDQYSSLAWAHPLVREWFLNKFGSPTEPQLAGWPTIVKEKNTLISAPTGSGKTFAAFLVCIDKLVKKALDHRLENITEVIYVSPLKALSNDVEKNLTQPLSEIFALAKQKKLLLDEIRVAVRTGDTPTYTRQKMLKNPPHILVTTPESLYILLTAEKSRLFLTQVKTLIIDEIHALANNKRGSHLMVTIERLEKLCQHPPLRIGLSATQKPMTLIAEFLSGSCTSGTSIIDIGYAKHLEVDIDVPQSKLEAVASNDLWDEIYNRLAELALQNRSTLVFVNTRRITERVAHHLSTRLGENQVAAHHGSLSRKLRLDAENKLKNGELKILIATASLELGIDIGMIDLVCQVGSPRAIAIALQRIGRAGHWRGAISCGKIIPTTRDELIECAALVRSIREGDLDKLIIPKEPLDILSQQIIAACASQDWDKDELFSMVKKSFPYRQLSSEKFNEIIEMLAEGIAGSRGRYGAYLHYDQINNILRGRRGSRMTAIMNGGAIPDTGLFTVILEPDHVMVGTLDEDFAIDSHRGDIILLGSTSWRIQRIESFSGKVFVEDAHGASPNVPFWRGEAPARTAELSWQVSRLREDINAMLKSEENKEKIASWLDQSCGVHDYAAYQLIQYFIENCAILGTVPSLNTVIAERFFDESGGMQLVIHSPYGARINKAWGLALRKKFCRSFNFELQAAATDNGLNISLAEQHSFPLLDVFQFLHANTIKKVLIQAVLQSPLFTTRWRWVAGRSLAIKRFRNGKKIPPNIIRMLADDLLAAVFPDAAACQDNLGGRDVELPDHPLIEETMKDALTEALDVEGLTLLLKNIASGKVKCIAVDSVAPSPFSHEIINANPYAFLDDAPLEERRARAVAMRHIIPESMLKDIGKLDIAAINEIEQQAWPDIRTKEELHDILQTCIILPADVLEQKNPQAFTLLLSFFNLLVKENRAYQIQLEQKIIWIAAEKFTSFNIIYPDPKRLPPNLPQHLMTKPLDRETLILEMLRGWLSFSGPITAEKLSLLLTLSRSEIEQALLKLEASGFILRGHFRQYTILEWCERRLLARIHKYTLAKLRHEIEPVAPKIYMQWLLRWQHLTPDTRVRGREGLLEVIRQLQGFELPAKNWERHIFAKRVEDYSPDLLDNLCITGVIGWGRFSHHPALIHENPETHVRINPTSIAPLTFFIRNDLEWLPLQSIPSEHTQGLSYIAIEIHTYLKKYGAAFFMDIVRGVNHLNAEIETALWELVVAGIVSADSFDNLRALIDARRRLRRRGYHTRPQYSSARWFLLPHFIIANETKRLEQICWLLLKRYGIILRDILYREKLMPPWRVLLPAFRSLESRGEIRSGRFIKGFTGEQFALPYAMESLRLSKNRLDNDTIITIAPSDPLNLVGIILPGERTRTNTTNKIIFKNGELITES